MPQSKSFVFAGIDYLRLTASDHAPYAAWHDALLPEYLAEQHAGRRQHMRWLLGYYGQVGEHCFVGKGEQGTMVQVSGALADRLFRSLSHVGGRCSRVDLQLTAPGIPTPSEYLRNAFREATDHEKRQGRESGVELRDTNKGAKMLSVGSRVSDVYGRIYDKGRESKEREWDGHVRWEIEVKGEQAQDLHHWLLDDATRVHTIKPIVANFFEQRGIATGMEDWGLAELPKQMKRTRTDETRLAWVGTQVSKAALELIERGKAIELARALLPPLTDDAIILEVARQFRRAIRDYHELTGTTQTIRRTERWS